MPFHETETETFPLGDAVEQVSLLCPDVDADDIRLDLSVTKNIELTVNKILDGSVFFRRKDSSFAHDTSHILSNYSTGVNGDDSDDSLPSINVDHLKLKYVNKRVELLSKQSNSSKLSNIAFDFNLDKTSSDGALKIANNLNDGSGLSDTVVNSESELPDKIRLNTSISNDSSRSGNKDNVCSEALSSPRSISLNVPTSEQGCSGSHNTNNNYGDENYYLKQSLPLLGDIAIESALMRNSVLADNNNNKNHTHCQSVSGCGSEPESSEPSTSYMSVNHPPPLEISSSDSEMEELERKPLSEILSMRHLKTANSVNIDIMKGNTKALMMKRCEDTGPTSSKSNYKVSVSKRSEFHSAGSYEDDLPDLCEHDRVSPYSDFPTSQSSLGNTQDSISTCIYTESSQMSTAGSEVSTTTTSSKGTKRKRTAEEIEQKKRQAEAIKAEKQRIHDEKVQERDAKKLQKQNEANAKKAIQDTKRSMKPENYKKFMTLVVDLTLVNEGSGTAILKGFEQEETRCVTEIQCVPRTVLWKRHVVDHHINQDGQVEIINEDITECEVLNVIPSAAFVQMVDAFKQKQAGGSLCQLTPCQHIQSVQASLPGKRLTLIVMGMEKYFREQKNSKKRQHRDAVRLLGSDECDGATAKGRSSKKKGVDDMCIVSRLDVEECLVDLQLQTDVNHQLLEAGEELVDLLKAFTKSIAEAPSKKDRLESAFSFHIEGGGGVGRVDKSGHGLLRVWKLQLQQFRAVSAEMSNAIVDAYPSPQLLIQAYNNCSSEYEKERLLEDIVVRRGAGVLETTRRLGGELSRRVYQCMNYKQFDFVIK